MRWNYLPELPPPYVEVHVALVNNPLTSFGVYGGVSKKWVGPNINKDTVYAWAELPEKPPTQDPEAEEKRAWLKENPEHYL